MKMTGIRGYATRRGPPVLWTLLMRFLPISTHLLALIEVQRSDLTKPSFVGVDVPGAEGVTPSDISRLNPLCRTTERPKSSDSERYLKPDGHQESR